MAMMQSPTLLEPRTQPCSCHSVSTHLTSPTYAHPLKHAKARGGTVLFKQIKAMAPLNAEAGDPANSNSVSAAELRSSHSIQSPAASEDVLDLLLQSAELLLILGVAGAQGSLLLLQRQQQQQQLVQLENKMHSRSTHKHQVCTDPCKLLKRFIPAVNAAVSSNSLACHTKSSSCLTGTYMTCAGDQHGRTTATAATNPRCSALNWYAAGAGSYCTAELAAAETHEPQVQCSSFQPPSSRLDCSIPHVSWLTRS